MSDTNEAVVQSLPGNLSNALRTTLGRDEERTGDGATTVMPSATAHLVLTALGERASDVHVDPDSEGVRVLFRIDGRLHDRAHLAHDEGQQLINQVKAMVGLDPIPAVVPEEGRKTCAIDDHELDLRAAATPCLAGEKLTVRILDTARLIRRVQELGLSSDMYDHLRMWLDDISGACLVTGPTGSGKTTTLYALLDRLVTHQKQIVTLEDPVEYRRDRITQIQIDEDRGLTFAEGIKSMLRLDPDYLLLGEIRDAASARAAIDAACSGRVLLSTLHGRDAVGAITSLRNWGLENHEITNAVDIIIAQRLVRKLCPSCRQQGTPTEEEHRWIQRLQQSAPQAVWHPRGCDQCGFIGFHERTGIFEVWRLSRSDYEGIQANANEQVLRRRLAEAGHHFLLADGWAKVSRGVTTIGELRMMGGTCSTGAG